MMADLGMFGMTPDQIRQQQQATIDANALGYAKLDPFTQANYAVGRGSGMLAAPIAEMTGGVNPQIQQAQQMQDVLKGADTNSPEGWYALAQKFHSLGMTQQAIMAADKARELQTKIIADNETKAKTALYTAQATDIPQARKAEAEARIQIARDTLQQNLDIKTKELAQQADLAKQRSEDMRYGISERNAAAEESRRLQLQIAEMNNTTRLQIAQLTKALGEKSPSYRDIIDPKDPTRLITINGNIYTPGGSLGDPGVIGIAGKEPTAAKKEAESATGAENADNLIMNLRDKYKQLQENGGIVDPNKSGLSNVGAWTSASSVGQTLGGMVGSKNQTLRDEIIQTRPLLLTAIKQRTGMSAKQMDSNVELKLWLATATDPTKSIEANLNALNNIEKMIGSGSLKNNSAPTVTNSVIVNVKSIAEAEKLPPGTKFNFNGRKGTVN